MKRRDLIRMIAGSAAAWPLAAHAEGTRRVGMLVGSADNAEGHSRVAAFRQALNMLGWTEGHNLRIDLRWGAANTELTQTFAREIIAVDPDLIFAETTPVVAAVLRENRKIPVVFVNVSDPIGSGFVDSLARPGGLVTGFISNEATLASKWLELLKQVVPRLQRAALLFNPHTASYVAPFLKAFETAAASLAVQPIVAQVNDVAELES